MGMNLFYERSKTHHTLAATNPDAGIVKIHAHTMLRATPQRTAAMLCREPTPTIEPVIVCVVDTGIPKKVAANKVTALADSAQNPLMGFNLVIFMPIVFTIRHPPKKVPKAMTKFHKTMTHCGT